MKILSFGSLNYDHVYQVEHFVVPKETMSADSYSRGFGGKGLNQSVALARAGLEVYHAGRAGADGRPFVDFLESSGVRTEHLLLGGRSVSGHAIIEVCRGENRILIFGGANRQIDSAQIDRTLPDFGEGDILVIQNEISSLPQLIRAAKGRGMKVFFNAAPMDSAVKDCPLELVDTLCLNEIEGAALAEVSPDSPGDVAAALHTKYPDVEILLTAGEQGSWYMSREERCHMPARRVAAVDTTAAGDCYIGYYIAGRCMGRDIGGAMRLATCAAALAVQRHGAADSVPAIEEVLRNE